eukprot:m.72705 g.72705  ORF g.72705 m.72705 type:complete len:778 (+) comp8394_c0_seq3:126-2459(+)
MMALLVPVRLLVASVALIPVLLVLLAFEATEADACCNCIVNCSDSIGDSINSSYDSILFNDCASFCLTKYEAIAKKYCKKGIASRKAYSPCSSPTTDLYVDPVRGNDANSGASPSSAFKTIYKAVDTLSQQLHSKVQGVEIHLMDGEHDVSTGVVQLNASHSGTNDFPVIFSSSSGARINAGKMIPLSAVKTVTLPQGTVYQVDLKALGIYEYGNITCNSGLGNCPAGSSGNEGRMELFVNGAPLVLARYPNINLTSGYWEWNNIASVANPQTQFSFHDATHPKKWTNESDVWLWGYWQFGWADSVVKVQSIDLASNSFMIDPSTPPTYGFKEKARWFGFNVLSELDIPGEYYIDRTSGILSFIPPIPMASVTELVVSVGKGAISLSQAQYINFQNATIMFSQKNGFVASQSSNISFIDGTVSCVGGHGIAIDGANNTVANTNVHYTGCKGIIISGGDTKIMSPSGSSLVDNSISGFSRHTRTYNPGISWSGVAHVISGNSISNAPHSAVLGGGNNLLFEYNNITHVGFEVDDSGAFYTGRSWVQLGNIIRYNSFSSIRTRVPVFLGSPSVQAIYLDDEMSGYEVYNNTFYDCQVGMFIGGGRWNKVKFNTFEKCDTAVHVDDRGLGWQNAFCLSPDNYIAQLISVNYQEPPYAVRYPFLPNTLEEMPCYPVYNQIVSNTACDCDEFIDYNTTQLVMWRNVYDGNDPSAPSGCVAVQETKQQEQQHAVRSVFKPNSLAMQVDELWDSAQRWDRFKQLQSDLQHKNKNETPHNARAGS